MGKSEKSGTVKCGGSAFSGSSVGVHTTNSTGARGRQCERETERGNSARNTQCERGSSVKDTQCVRDIVRVSQQSHHSSDR